MKVFTFDPLTREYAGEEDAFVEPVNGMDLCSPNGTFLAPLADVPPGNSQIFQGGEWRSVPDHRGKRALDISSKRFYTVSQLGSLPPHHVIVDEDMERDYLDHPDHYVLMDTSFSKRSGEEIAAIEVGTAKRRKRSDRDAMLSSTDWKVFRKEDAIRLGISADGAADTINLLALYRQYLRDFTKRDSWWQLPIASLEEFENLENNERELS